MMIYGDYNDFVYFFLNNYYEILHNWNLLAEQTDRRKHSPYRPDSVVGPVAPVVELSLLEAVMKV